MSKITCWFTEDGSNYKDTPEWRGPAYAFLFEHTRDDGTPIYLSQYLAESVLTSAGVRSFQVIADTIAERTGFLGIDIEDVMEAFGNSRHVSEYTKLRLDGATTTEEESNVK